MPKRSGKGPLLHLPLAALSCLCRLAAQVLIALAVGLALLKGAAAVTDVGRFAVLRGVSRLEARVAQPLTAALRAHLPPRLQGRKALDWGAVVLIYLAALVMSRAGTQCGRWGAMLRYGREADDPLSTLESADRDELLEIYTRAKKNLDASKRELAFLSVDVVDSTKMKEDADPGVAQRDFKQYRLLVERCVAAHGALKSTWTPDGAMHCFADVPSAVRAARDLLQALPAFNRDTKSLRADFRVRVGIHAGAVYYDPKAPLDEMSDRTIDIAGHMQKHGPPDAICLSREVIAPHLGELPFAPAARRVDGLDVYEWRPPRTAVTS